MRRKCCAPGRSTSAQSAVARGADVHGDVPLGLPALLRAAKLSRRATRAGVEDGGADALAAEVEGELAGASAERFGDFLFALAARASARGVDSEAALREACARFAARAKPTSS